MKTSRKPGIYFSLVLALATTAQAQFKETPPAPYSTDVARQKIRTLLDKVDPGNRQQTVDTLSGLVTWYRDILDEELIAAWQGDGRSNLPQVIESLADSHVAQVIVDFSWRQRREAMFIPAYAPMLGHLMARYRESSQPFLDDLLGPAIHGQPMPDLSQPEAETVCRILLDIPDIGSWKKSALQILPHYRRTVESLLAQDVRGSDREKSYRAQVWQSDLRLPDSDNDAPNSVNPQQRQVARTAALSQPAPRPAPVSIAPVQTAPPAAVVASPGTKSYEGAQTGTFECTGSPIPQNAEYVFRNVPMVKLQLDYDTKVWDARLAPGDGQTQRLILRNKSSGPQKKCAIHWSVLQ